MPLIGWKLVTTAVAAGAASAGVVTAGHPVGLLHPPAAPRASCATTVGRAVCGVTADPHVRTAMLLGALLEGGNLAGPWACGDSGWSCGPWQIYRLAHPNVTRAQSKDADWAAAYMAPAYRAGCRRVPAARWRADPRGAAARCAYLAERPRRMYPTARVNAAWARLMRSPR